MVIKTGNHHSPNYIPTPFPSSLGEGEGYMDLVVTEETRPRRN